MRSAEYSAAAQRFLLDEARRSVAHGLEHGVPAPPASTITEDAVTDVRACFVTLKVAGELRGCTGSLEAEQPLAHGVVYHAFQSAFGDPRFPALTRRELSALDVEISVLSPLSPVRVTSERELLARLQPHVDGLLLEFGAYRATFLPKVWETLPDPADFLAHLKHKAGLPVDFWSSQLTVFRYQTESFSDLAA